MSAAGPGSPIPAEAIMATWTVIVFGGLLAAFGYPLAHGVTHFSQRLPSYVQAAEHGRGWIGHLVTRFHLQAWVNRNAPKLQSLGTTLAKPALTAGKGAASLLATLATIFALIVLFLLESPKMRQGLLGLMPSRRAAYYTRVAREICQSATGYALGNLLTSLIAGVVIFVTLSLLGVVGTSIGDWVGGFFGSFVGALLAIPAAGALQVITRELWQASARPQ
jgi:predicted PurR-regulated permease PerM